MIFKNKKHNVPKPIHSSIGSKMDDLDLTGLDIPDFKSTINEPPRKEPPRKEQKPRPIREEPFVPRPGHQKIVIDNTLFVKIDSYKESMRTLNVIKEGLMNTEHILDELNHIKEREDKEIREWHDQIKRIKQKILHIDKSLFEQ